MRFRLMVSSFTATCLILSVPLVRSEEPQPGPGPKPVADQLAELHLLQGPWDGGTIHRESALFVQREKDRPSAKLLFDAQRILEVRRADGTKQFTEGKDFELSDDGSTIVLTPDSTVPFLREDQLFLPKGSPGSIPHKTGDPETNLFFDNGHGFHDLQVEITYASKDARWNAHRPEFAGDRLPHTVAKLRRKEPVTITISGDSISEGANASALTKAPPFMPSYPGLVAAQLEAAYGDKVTLHNLAVGGWSSRNGVADLHRVLDTKPDLVIIAYGMNDVGRRDPKAFGEEIATMIKGIHDANADTEIILIATMTGNSEWVHTPPDMFPVYRDVLKSFEKPGIVLADLTSIWQRLLQRKRFNDITGNGVNHPDDYGHRVYAQDLLSLLVEPSRIPKPD